jgi:hypothetical protein
MSSQDDRRSRALTLSERAKALIVRFTAPLDDNDTAIARQTVNDLNELVNELRLIYPPSAFRSRATSAT